MRTIAERIDFSSYGRPQAHVESEAGNVEGARGSVRGFAGLAVLLLVSGLTVAIARGGVSTVEGVTGPAPGVLGFAWVMQGLAAVVYFVLAVRWLRN